ncbi:carbohydrate binding family 9 domain-containing protein [candidate division KSB1 bacterium]|nr:carbohydrate binding family 9 domain-containing protein [candidate division KSB1 bacterium]
MNRRERPGYNRYLVSGCNIFFASLVIAWSAIACDNTNADGQLLQDQNGKRVIHAIQTGDAVKIDGRLDEPDWEAVTFQGGFLQREPEEGQPASERTEVGILYDDQNLYFGIKCFDSEPGKIIAREMRRDAVVDDDDYFEMVIDTYHDQRSGYYFITNAHGSRRDAQLANEGRDYNPAWDAVWRCKSHINDEGWFLEIAIPWKTLRFAELDSSRWGINFARMIRRKNEHVYWQLIPRHLGGAAIFRLSEAGTLQGLAGLKMGGNLELRPYFLGGLENDQGTNFATDHLSDIGLDSKIAVTANLALDLTVNTDFAQVEADQEQVNLTRFSLYYPEKRDFFLEGAEIFAFGSSGHWRGGSSDMNLFYSRRLGLADGHEARILGGARMVGKIGRYRIGMMNIFTDDISFTESDNKTIEIPATNFSVLRLSRDVLRRGSIGVMLLNKEETHSVHYNRSLGIDSHLPLSNHLTLSGYFAGTGGPAQLAEGRRLDMKQKNLAGKIGLDYNSDLWQFSTTYQDIGARFNPEMGFNRRSDFILTTASIEYAPRPKNSKLIRQYKYQVSGNYRSNHDHLLLDSKVEASFSIEFQNSARLGLDVDRSSEFVDYDWELRKGFLIPSDTYTGYSYSLSAQSDRGKPVAGEIDVDFGDYYTGSKAGVDITGTVTRIQPVRMEIDYSHNYIDLPQGYFHTNTLGLRMTYFFSTELYLKAYIQWNDDKLNFDGRERVISNILLRWMYSPESNLYLVYNDGRMIGPDHTEIVNRTFMIKATFFWRR